MSFENPTYDHLMKGIVEQVINGALSQGEPMKVVRTFTVSEADLDRFNEQYRKLYARQEELYAPTKRIT